MATVDEKKRNKGVRKKRRLLRFLSSVILLAVISIVAVILISGKGNLSLNGIKRLLGATGAATEAHVFPFESGYSNVFADMNGGFAVASSVGVQVFDAAGNKAYTEVYEMTDPTIVSAGGVCAAYDLGGTAVKVFDTAGVLGSMKTDAKIISASLGSDGTLVLCTQASGGYKAFVSVYKNGAYDYTKDPPFRWKSGEGYVLSAALSPDSKSIAVLTLTADGSRIVFFSLDSPEEKASCALPGKLALGIRYADDGHVLAVCKDSVELIDTNGKNQDVAEYADKYLAEYSIGDSFAALVLSDYMVGNQGKILTVDKDGKTLGTLEADRKILSVSARGDYLAVLYADGFSLYDKNLRECAHEDDTAGAIRTIMRQDGTALLITPHSASVFSLQKAES